MKKIGIAGTIASGKTTFCILLKRRGFPVFNSDRYAAMCLHAGHPAAEKIVAAFGSDVLDKHGDVDRKKLAEVVFHNEEKRKQLNDITHPYVIGGMDHFFSTHANLPFAFAEVPLLFEAGLEDKFDEVIVVTCTKETAVKRMMEDRDYSEEEANVRYASQIDAQKQMELADIVIHNDGTMKDLDHEVNLLLRRLRGRRS